jgi:hypothetical protein
MEGGLNGTLPVQALLLLLLLVVMAHFWGLIFLTSLV